VTTPARFGGKVDASNTKHMADSPSVLRQNAWRQPSEKGTARTPVRPHDYQQRHQCGGIVHGKALHLIGMLLDHPHAGFKPNLPNRRRIQHNPRAIGDRYLEPITYKSFARCICTPGLPL
jgi:hypothetical protein